MPDLEVMMAAVARCFSPRWITRERRLKLCATSGARWSGSIP